ncbi:hypothetical protein BK133_16585 [Paenibacillus sp. FSL H8-0548]|uniref:ABC transporter substrate-binding protein n=1 Tax=Paenibacillus sp. FSL H8-0548 TaxID=1920422 RepID=UPI00096F4C3D|nr:extracellular solute-binding protein [Paenibacillus sp. FSL H8-0548]OMF30755.1 hypothetical protein BK133_16585 [Paenibacillus sp. FSL H8-0548]
MRRLKKLGAMTLVLALSIGLLIGCGGNNASGNNGSTVADNAGNTGEGSTTDSQPVKKIRFFTKGNENNADYRVMKSLIDQYRKEVNPNFEVEIESIPNDTQYFQKLRTYIAGNQLPDFFKIPNGVLSENLAKQGRLVDMKATLEEFGMFDKFNKAAIDFLSFGDGSLYLYPEGKFGEAFWYYKKPFEENNIKVPTNFDEFVQASAKLKEAGYTPIAVSGKEMWQMVRYLSFIPLRLTHTEFINTLKTGDETFTGEIGMKAANLLYTLGKEGYFQKGFSSMDYTQTLNFFLGGNAVMHYNGSWELAQFKDKYDAGEIGYFFVPDVVGADNIGPKTSITAGLAYAFNAETFDAPTKDFFKFVVEHYNNAAFEVGGFLSPMNGDIPESMSQLTKDFSKDLESVDKGGVSWDDKLDPASNEVIGTAAIELALGIITPEEFAAKVDKAISQNAPEFFKDQK